MKLFITPKGIDIKVHDLALARINSDARWVTKTTNKEFIFQREDIVADPVSVANSSTPVWTLYWVNKGNYVVRLPSNNRGFDYVIIPFDKVEVM